MFFMVHFVLQNIYSIFCNKIVPCKLFFDVCSTRNPLVYVETIIYMVICCNTGDVFCNNNFRHVLKLVNVIELPGNQLDRILCIILYLLSTIFLCSCVFSRILICKTKHHATVRQTTDAQDFLVVQLQIEAEQTFHKDI